MRDQNKMEHPFTCIVAGPTKAGKTTFVRKVIESDIIKPKIHKIWWCFAEDQPLYKNLNKNINFVKGMPDLNKIKSFNAQPQLIILDDLMQEMKGNQQLIQLFTRGCHHWGVSIIHIVQNIFFEGLRTSRINTDYLVLFKNPGDQLQSQILARYLFPLNQKYFLETYADATKSAHSYLFVDLTQKTDDDLRLKTNIFEKQVTFYVQNSINMDKFTENKKQKWLLKD